MGKTITEKEIVKVKLVRISMTCPYLLGKCDCSFGRQFQDVFCPGRILNVLCTFNLRPVSTGIAHTTHINI